MKYIFATFLLLLLFAGCERGVHYANMTDEEKTWMPYDTVRYPHRFVNELNDTFRLEMTERNFAHVLQPESNDKNTYISQQAYAHLKLDNFLLDVQVEKFPRSRRHAVEEFFWSIHAKDMSAETTMPVPPYTVENSVQVGSHTYNNVYVFTYDTMYFPQNPQCWRCYYQPGTGFLELDIRGGRYYKILP